MKLIRWIAVFVLFSLLGAACNMPVTPTPEAGPSQIWITSPGSGAVLPLAPVNLTFEGASFVGITEFEIKIDGNPEANISPSSSGSCGANCGTKFFGEYLWTPPGIGEYTIALRAFGGEAYSPSVEITVKIQNVVAAEEGENIPLLVTAIPTLPLIPDAAEPEKVVVIGLQNGNCRQGGSTHYPVVDTLMKDQSAEAVARSEDGYYVKIISPRVNAECWIWLELVRVEQGDVDQLPTDSYPFLPEPAPEDNSTKPDDKNSSSPTATPKPAGVP